MNRTGSSLQADPVRQDAYTNNRRRMVYRDRGKKTAIRPAMIASPHHAPPLKSPPMSARARLATGVKGAIQLRCCTKGGNESSGKNTPLKKNIGVMNSVK